MGSEKRIAGNLFYLLVGGTVATGFEFIVAIWLARKLTDVGFGMWSLVESVVINFAIVVDAGLSIYGVREIARNKSRLSEFVANILVLRSMIGVLLYVLFAAVLFLLPLTGEMKILVLGGALWLFPQAINPEFVFQGLERMAGVAVWRVLNFLFYLVFTLLLVRQRADLWSVPYFKAGAAILSAFVIWPFIRRYLVFPLSGFLAPKKWPHYLRVSIVMAASIMVVKVYFTFDTLMLGLMDSPQTVGWYNAAYKIVLQFVGLILVVQFVFGPVLARLKDHREEFNHAMSQYNVLSLVLAGIFCGTLFTSSPTLIRWLYGASYVNSVVALRLLSISLYFVFIQKVFLTPLIYGGFERRYLLAMLIGTIVNILLNSILIPLFSYTGAAVATIISNALIAFVAILYYGKHFEISLFMNFLLGSTLVFCISLGIVSLIPVDPLLSTLFFTALFCAVLMMFYTKTFKELFSYLFGLMEHSTGQESEIR